MNVRRTILFAMPALLYALCIAFAAIWVLEIRAHTEFTDHAAPLVAGILFLVFPIALLIMWVTGRKGVFRRYDKAIAWLSIVPVLIPWGFVCVAFLAVLGWRGD